MIWSDRQHPCCDPGSPASHPMRRPISLPKGRSDERHDLDVVERETGPLHATGAAPPHDAALSALAFGIARPGGDPDPA